MNPPKPKTASSSAAPPKSLVIPAPAKLNLFLHITGQRSDGYHLLQTAFQLLDYGDTVELQLRDDNQILMLESLAEVNDQDNIVIKAAIALRDFAEIHCSELFAGQDNPQLSGVSIRILKKIPMGGGLGGGSSDAASTLLGLNQLWDLGLSLDQLATIGLKLGADVPVFVHGQSGFAEGVGEQLIALELPKRWFAVIKPPVSVPTAAIFAYAQLTRDTRPIRIAAFFDAQQSPYSDSQIDGSLHNDCEPAARKLYPAIDQALLWFDQHLASSGRTAKAKLTGTGACIFAGFDTQAQAQAVIDAIPLATGMSGFIAQGTNRSIAHQALFNEYSLINSD